MPPGYDQRMLPFPHFVGDGGHFHGRRILRGNNNILVLILEF